MTTGLVSQIFNTHIWYDYVENTSQYNQKVKEIPKVLEIVLKRKQGIEIYK